MLFIVVLKKATLRFILPSAMVLVLIISTMLFLPGYILHASGSDDFLRLLDQAFLVRNNAILSDNYTVNEQLYDTQNANGSWAYKYEAKRIEYLNKWANKQGIKFSKIDSRIKTTSSDKLDKGYWFKFICSTEYEYSYLNDPDKVNLFRIVTYHYIEINETEKEWKITKEWYLDPFEYSLIEDRIGSESTRDSILLGEPRDFSDLNENRIHAVDYADRYCGASGKEKYGVLYNPDYNNYNGIGGDCTNFISQVLHEGGKFREDSLWYYDKSGSDAWVNAESFLKYMLYSGKASLISYGTYEKVLGPSYKLEPGDLISYERKGRVEHTAVVTGADAKGYTLVNCHTVDGYRVPWDLGWNNNDVRFYLLRVHY